MKRPWLAPLVPLYAAGAALRAAGLLLGLERVQQLAWPVVSVGSLSAGGAGKTPFVIALAQLFKREGRSVDVLSRGYGREDAEVARVDPDGSADRFGDEPLLIANEIDVPVYVAAQRWRAGGLAERDFATMTQGQGIHLLDDGFQHRQLARNVDVVLVGSEDLRDQLLPAGNLREPVGALRRATVLAVPAEDEAAMNRLRKLGFQQPVWRIRRQMNLPSLPLINGPVVAFCGIARPEQFFTGLERLGVAIAARHAFRDHHPFQTHDVALLARLVEKTGAKALVTTAKDRVRMGVLAHELERAAPLHTAGLRVEFEGPESVAGWLRNALGLAAHKSS